MANPNDLESRRNLRLVLERWRDNDARLQPFVADSWALQSIDAFSQPLTQLGVTGLQALDALENNTKVTAAEHAAHLESLKAAEVHRSMLQMAVTPGIRRLADLLTQPGASLKVLVQRLGCSYTERMLTAPKMS